jgi:hypothetical protein
MTILSLDSPRGPRSGKSLKLALVAGAVAAIVAVASTLAANININSGPVEFGQGVAQTTACSGDDAITLTPQSTFVNSATDANFYFTSLSVSGIPSSCIDTNFKFSAYGETGTALTLTDCTDDGGSAPVVFFTGDEETDQTEQSNYDMYAEVYDVTSTGFSLTWQGGEGCDSVALASQVYKVTVETFVGDEAIPDIGDYVVDYTSGSTIFNTTPIFSIDADSVTPNGQVWSDNSTSSTLNLQSTATFTNSSNPYVDFTGINATASLGESLTGLDRATVELWVRFNDTADDFSAQIFRFDVEDVSDERSNCGYGLFFNQGYLGVNTCNDDTLGFSATSLNNQWHHIVWIASTGDRYTQKIYVDGQIKVLTRFINGDNPDENPRPILGSGGITLNSFGGLNSLNVGAVQLHVAHVLGLLALAGIRMAGDGGFELVEVNDQFIDELLVRVGFHGIVGLLRPVQRGAAVDIFRGAGVEREDGVLAAGLDGHVSDGHAVIHRQRRDAGAVELHRTVGRAVEADLADDVQDDVLGHDARLELTFEPETHRLGNLDEQLAGAHDETRVGVADAGGELVERAGHAGVRIGAEEHFARAGVALGRQRGVADAGVVGAVLFLEQPL